jgi:putative restriction endonuclease
MHHGNPDVIHLASVINRTPGSIAMRLGNFASVDLYHQQRGIGGLPGGVKQCQPIWDEFIDHKEELIFESERILAEKEHLTIESKYADILMEVQHLKGETKIREVKTRVNQHVFRQIILGIYSGKCAITGIDIPDLLVASHIVPWSQNEEERLNPENGICLSALYDRAFDKGLIGITEGHSIIVSQELRKKETRGYYQTYFAFLQGAKITVPDRFKPRKEFLQYHLDSVFQR